MKTNKKFGWRKDSLDMRDMLLLPSPTASTLPPKIDMRPQAALVRDQGDLGSCVANCVAEAVDFEIKKQLSPAMAPSRLFLYYLARELEGTIDSDSGAELRDGIKVVARYGVAPESMWPYNIANYTAHPPSICYVLGLTHLIDKYLSLTGSFQAMKECLAAGYPFVFGFAVFESFMSTQVEKTGIVPMPKRNESYLGGHAVLCLGYDDTTQRVLCQNSWGTGWGQQGFFEMPYHYISNPNLAGDMWSIRFVRGFVPPAIKVTEGVVA